VTSIRCDSHVHIVGPIAQYPQVATRTYLAPPASLDELTHDAAPRDVRRFVIVQPSFYGADNTVLLESLDALGPRGRGVVVIDPAETSKVMLEDYAARGVRGLRINLYSPGKAAPGQLAREFRAMANVAGAMGWHVEVIAPIAILAEAATLLARTDVTMVIDHYGVYGHSRPESAAGRVLLELLELPHVWMKLSAPYRVSDDPLETRPDPAWLAAILACARERCVWGSDWPHTPAHDAHRGADAMGVYRPLPYVGLLDNFTGALASDELASMILADNPARLYEFAD
jgi:predicted TIM-barrel fold metal-dependent hydrolase